VSDGAAARPAAHFCGLAFGPNDPNSSASRDMELDDGKRPVGCYWANTRWFCTASTCLGRTATVSWSLVPDEL
jgi:hypothetical protein